ncbi:NAD-dependent formate dehydrogenase iron-sulfur protein [SAR116 cluster alpha proteobacterium HIMB100]|nr:NAD-dependent formate dehydrogenase iron-sulfur protein [SAR116 cluster alpha proteobacterium HIMB100]
MDDMTPKQQTVRFVLDGKEVTADAGQTIWQVARQTGTDIPHLCYKDDKGYRADGNCRACMVEIEGERVLAASCQRKIADGIVVSTASARAETARKMVMELLVADQPERDVAPSPSSQLWTYADSQQVTSSRFDKLDGPQSDSSHPAIAVNMDACIQCNLCVRACREVQVNDVIGLAGRGADAHIIFDFDDEMGASTCVGCGECVQACPTGALMPKTVLDETQKLAITPDSQIDSVCPYCGVGCQLTFHVKDEKIVSVSGRDGPANQSRLCVKGRYGFDYIHHQERLTVPMIRRADVPKSAGDTFDPAAPHTHFREATWEEALNVAAAGFATIKSEHGSAALAGFGSAKGTNEEAYLVQKFVRTCFQTNNVDHCTRLCHASSVAALLENIGSGAVTASFSQCQHSDAIIVIGANPTVNHPVAATFIKNAAQRGAELFVLDPRGQALDRHATASLRFTPGTDVALLNGMINTIITEELYDTAYVEAHTEGFASLAEQTAAMTPEAMAPVCGIEADVIRDVARRFARAKAGMIFWGMGVSQHTHGTDNARCLISLALICGHVGREGAGLHPLRGQNNVQGASDAGLIPMFYPDYKSVTDEDIRSKYESVWNVELDTARGLTVVEIADAAYERTIKGIYVMGENPIMSDPDQNHAKAAFARLEHLVVQDIFMTETAAYADVILPASAFPEKTGTVTNTDRRVQLGRIAVPMPGDARQDWWIITALARRMGQEWAYKHPRDIFAEMRLVMPSLTGITWDRLEAEDAVTYPCADEHSDGQDVIFSDSFPTVSGRGRLTPADVLPPDEVPDETYPLVMSTGRLLEHWHTGSMTRRASVLDALEPVAEVHVSPADLEALQISAGQQVQVETRRGQIQLAARVDPKLPKGMIFVPFCFTEAPANQLTNPALDPFGKIPELKFSAARLSAIS